SAVMGVGHMRQAAPFGGVHVECHPRIGYQTSCKFQRNWAMARIWIVVGDATTHGGRVLGGSPFTSIEGKSVARMGDAVACPKCGPTTIVSGDATIVVDGQPLARHGDSTTCGATLIAGSQVRAFIDSGAAAGSGAGGTAVAAASAV